MSRTTIDYSKACVYVIANHVNDKLYIGSTTQSLSKRWSIHRCACDDVIKQHRPLYQDMIEHGFDMFYITKVEDVNASCKADLHKIEGYHIKRLQDEGINLYNQHVAGRNKKTWYEDNREHLLDEKKKYRLRNLERINEYQRTWRDANRDSKNEYQKLYRGAHKAEMKEKACKKVTCECGSVVSQAHHTQHKRSAKHIKWQDEQTE